MFYLIAIFPGDVTVVIAWKFNICNIPILCGAYLLKNK
jgi:hypothetical protein